MNSATSEEEMISIESAFDAMRWISEKHWNSRGRESDDIAILSGALNRDEQLQSMPSDSALWDDWMEAVETVKQVR